MPAPERFYPRAAIELLIDLEGREEPLEVTLIPRRVGVLRRSHTQADTADIELDGTEVPFDPRAIRSMLMRVFMGNAASTYDTDWRNPARLQFVGFVDLFEGEQDEDDMLSLKARDLSSLLRDCKPLPTAAAPLYSDTLSQAIQRVLDNVPGASALTLDIGDGDVTLSTLVGSRTSSGPIHLEREMTAWAVIEYVAGMANRLCSVDIGRLLVRPPRAVFDSVAGVVATLNYNNELANITKLGVQKKFIRQRKGIRAVGWDPIRRVRLEADYPSDNQLPSRRAPRATTPSTGRAGSHGGGRARARAAPQPPERDVYAVGAVQNKEALMEIAQGIWQERSRQELTVNADTPYYGDEWLALRNGQRVAIELNRAIAAGLNALESRAQRIAYVQRRCSVSRDVASVLVDAAENPGASTFYLREVGLRWDSEGDAGVKLELINLIAVEVGSG